MMHCENVKSVFTFSLYNASGGNWCFIQILVLLEM